MRTNQVIKYLTRAAFLTACLVPVAVGWRAAGVITQTWVGAPGWIAVGTVLLLAGIALKVRELVGIGAGTVGTGIAIPFWVGLALQPEWTYVLALTATFYAIAWLADRPRLGVRECVRPGLREGGLRG